MQSSEVGIICVEINLQKIYKNNNDVTKQLYTKNVYVKWSRL